MKKDYTHISIILDRSGSMESIRNDTIGGFNAFLDAQKKEPGDATLTLVQFDSQDPYEVIYDFKAVKDIPELTRERYVPRGGTPLLDALGRGINDLEQKISDLPEDARPSKLVMAIVTDGQENSSQEFRKEQIAKMIREHREKDNWQFVFLSSDLDSMADAHEYGIADDTSRKFNKDKAGTEEAWDSLTDSVKIYRIGFSNKLTFSHEDKDKKRDDKPQDDKNKID